MGKIQDLMLKDKIRRAEAEKKRKEQQQHQQRGDPKARRAEPAAAPVEGKEAGEDEAPKKEGEEEEKEKEDEAEEKKAEEDEQEEKEKEEDEKEKPTELTEDEKALWYRKMGQPDLLRRELATGFAHFSLPSESEGFDDIKFVWGNKEKCTSIMKEWIMSQKKTQRVEDLKPSAWFTERWDAWQ